MEMRFKKAAEAFLRTGKELRPFYPFPSAGMSEEYEKIPPDIRRKLIREGEEHLGFPYPAIRATDFMAFQRTGNRTDYEEIYFSRRYALNSLAVAECLENRGRFLDDIVNGIFSLCEESAWQLPAHNSYLRDTPQAILPDSTRPILDLFACETGAQLACIYYLLGKQLDAVSPFITGRIRHELTRRIVTPYLKEHFWWMGNGEEPMNNWTVWCTQNVLLTVFFCAAAEEAIAGKNPESSGETECVTNTDICRAVLLKAAESCDYFLKDYGEDGCCDEGAHYYRHAGLCLDGAAAVLNQVTNGAFEDLMGWEKIKNIAAYIFNVHVEDKYYFNFADCSPIAGRAGVREYLFGKRTGQPGLMQFAAEDFSRGEPSGLFADESHQLNLFYRLQTLFHYEEIKAYSASAPLVHRDIFYPSVGLFLARSRDLCLAVKAGDNNDSHNHNDTGSFTLYKKGLPVFVDIGVESYTQKTFSPRRYEIWTMQSGYHNLPTIDGVDQHDGAEYRAENVVTSMDGDGMTASISMELAGAYPLTDRKITYVREVLLDKGENRITLTDRTDSGNVILNFITYEKPEILGQTMKIGTAEIAFRGAEHRETQVLPITDKRLKAAWDHDLYRIRLTMTGALFEMTIR